MPKIRLDKFLLEKGYCSGIKSALGIILAGEVFMDGLRLDKPGILIDDKSIVNINQKKKYVSRGGEKLEKALDEFKPDIENKIAIDVGASSGGFSDCLLKHGIKKIYCIDVGYGQLDWILRNDPRVVLREKTNIRFLKKEDFKETIDLAVIDVSFISLKKVIPVVLGILKPNGEIIALIKPQFEVESKKVSKGGVVKDENYRKEAVDSILEFAGKNDLQNKGVVASPIKGPAGNVEYLCYLVKDSKEQDAWGVRKDA